MKRLKELLCIAFSLVLCINMNVPVYAAGNKISPYEEILNEANEEYDLNLGYIPVDEDKISLEEYKEKTYEFAAQQREILDYIQSKESSEMLIFQAQTTSNSEIVKTKTKATSNLSQYFTITATYTVYSNNRVSICRNASLNATSRAILTNTYCTNVSSPTYSVVDSGRTTTVKYTATVYINSLIAYSNTTLYTEFYYNE